MFFEYKRKVDDLGRIVLPIELRHKVGIEVNSTVRIYDDGDKISVEHAELACTQCGSSEDLVMLKNQTMICKDCARQIAGMDTQPEQGN